MIGAPAQTADQYGERTEVMPLTVDTAVDSQQTLSVFYFHLITPDLSWSGSCWVSALHLHVLYGIKIHD